MKVALLYPEVYDMARFKDKRKEFPPFGVLYLGSRRKYSSFTDSRARTSRLPTTPSACSLNLLHSLPAYHYSDSCRCPARKCTPVPTPTALLVRTCSPAGMGTGQRSTSTITPAGGGAPTPSGRKSSPPICSFATISKALGGRKVELATPPGAAPEVPLGCHGGVNLPGRAYATRAG